MFTKIALAAAIVVNAVAVASAATKSRKIAAHRGVPSAQPAVPRAPPRFSNPDSPEAAGAGNLGYNKNIYNW